jgi:3'-phosphoadenosine 5'-phosphosulfate sulfotransferase (PAPS reductase)/FAD synthetase
MPSDPFLTRGPTVISLSGGRTSAMMLYRTLQAHGGTLSHETFVLFANTGLEREETLEFLHEIQTRWKVDLRWLEYVPAKGGTRVGCREVNFKTAARKGEPFEAMMDHEHYMPNQRTRICTKNLKVLVMQAYMAGFALEPGDYAETIGFRADEPQRVAKSRTKEDDEDRVLRFPLFDAGVVKADVAAFWAKQPFDLQLQPHESNCNLCFLKGNAIRVEIMRRHPEFATWWIEQEEKRGHRFTKKGRKTYSELVQIARGPKRDLPDDAPEEALDCGCTD